ncbi:MAG: RNA-binding S4 domain-containing protein [Acholeplasmataceae bacterium]
MRIDKFLKVSRVIKRRTVAKEATEKGRILINDRIAKPGSKVSLGDIVTIKFASKTLIIEITSLSEKQHDDMFRIVKEV